ncbi:MAG: magnesium/cobalt transporter CorA [Bacteroidota bacterium]
MSSSLGIALAGGGARGIAHIGVLQALEEAGISPGYVSGASAGSIVGALYAAGKTPLEILDIFKNTPLLKLFKVTLPTVGLTDLANIKDILAEHIEADDFSVLKKKLFISVTNLSKGSFEIVQSGGLFEAVVASSSIPLLFKSRKSQEEIFVDGGLLNNLPVEPLTNACDRVIGVNVTPIAQTDNLGNLLTIGYRCLDLVMWANVAPRLKQCDLVIEPAAYEFGFFDVHKADYIYQLGYETAKDKIPALTALLNQQPLPIPKPTPMTTSETAKLGKKAPAVNRVFKRSRSAIANLTRMGTSMKEAAKTADLPPGTMLYVGEQRQGASELSLINYNEQRLEESSIIQPDDLKRFKNTDTVSWLNLDGIHEVELVNKIGDQFGLHPITKEDIVNSTQRPKLEIFDDYLYAVVKMIRFDEAENMIDVEQVSLVMGKGYVLSFQEKTEDVFEPLRERIRQQKGRVRKANSDYLFYALIDVILSNYFVALGQIEDRIDKIEEKITRHTGSDLLEYIQEMKKNLIFLKKSIMPLREVIAQVEREEPVLISAKTRIFFQDLKDQLNQVVDSLESYRELLNSLSDQYIALSGHRMNEIMKVLTIVATIFIPLTFIAGIYGMNFEYIPELKWKYSYFALWGVMLTMLGGMVMYFRRKGWI